jgi:agmatinase
LGHLWPQLNRKILNLALLRLRFCSIAATKLDPNLSAILTMLFLNRPYPAFLASELKPQQPEQALFHVVPVPFEKSVSYGRGTAAGPAAILAASQQLELFDDGQIPAEQGIYTHPALGCQGSAAEALTEIAAKVAAIAGLGKIPVLLGGEHTVTLGALQALAARCGRFGVVQFDAHADLRQSYEGSPLSHACVCGTRLDLIFIRSG